MNNKLEEPEAYHIGSIPFIHTEIFLDSKPLIPRPETEYWVDLVISEIKSLGRERVKILDLCAGSGCIGVATLKEISGALVDFVEIDKKHHQTIRNNIFKNVLDLNRVRIPGGNLFENISGQYDFILSNPPYIDKSLGRVAESVERHEPDIAINGGRNGLEIISKILFKVSKHLLSGGILYLEHEPEQVEYLSKHPLYQGSQVDQYNVLRFSRFKA